MQLQFYGEIQPDRVQGFSGRIYGPSSYLEAGAISRKEITVKIFTTTALRRQHGGAVSGSAGTGHSGHS